MSNDQDGCEWVTVFLVLAYPGSPGPKTVKRLCVCVCYKAVKTGTGQRKVMPSGWEGNHKSGIGITLLKAQGLSTCAYGLNLIKGDEHRPSTVLEGVHRNNQTPVFLRGYLLPHVGRTNVQWSQIRFNGIEPHVVGSSWRSFSF